jgi:hypothetical protein
VDGPLIHSSSGTCPCIHLMYHSQISTALKPCTPRKSRLCARNTIVSFWVGLMSIQPKDLNKPSQGPHGASSFLSQKRICELDLRLEITMMRAALAPPCLVHCNLADTNRSQKVCLSLIAHSSMRPLAPQTWHHFFSATSIERSRAPCT